MAAIDYPTHFPDFKIGKIRKEAQKYRTSQPFAGPLFTEQITDESPVTWDITIDCRNAGVARAFKRFLRTIPNGTPFNKLIKTENGHVEHEVKFVKEPLSPRENNNVWTYSGTIYAVALIDPDANVDDDLIINYSTQAANIDNAINNLWPGV